MGSALCHFQASRDPCRSRTSLQHLQGGCRAGRCLSAEGHTAVGCAGMESEESTGSRVCTGALDPKPVDPNITSPCSETPAGLSQESAGAQSRRERSLVVSRSNASASISSQGALNFLFPVCLRECFAVRDPSPWCPMVSIS